MSRTIQVSKIAILNRETFSKNETPRFFKYLDTGSLTKNVIDNFQTLDTTKEKIPSRAQRKVKDQTILYSTVRPNQEHYGFLIDPDENVVASTGFTTIDVVDEGVLPKFLYYLLTQNHITEYLHTIGTNSVSSYPSISPADIGFLEFEIPSLNIQTKIVKVLSDLDTKIELNNKINEELEAMAKAIYDYWFVQFDFPISKEQAQAMGNPKLEGKPYKSSGGKMVYNKELKREIPENWGVVLLSEIADLKAGGDKPKKWSLNRSNEFKIPIYSNGVTDDGLYGFTSKAKINTPSVTISARGTIGFSVLRMNPFVPIIRLISVTPKKSIYLKFIHERAKRLNFEDSGSVQKQLTVPMIADLKIIDPESEILKNFHYLTKSWIKKIELIKEENQKLTELRDWLLPMLMNGQVTVVETEEELSKAAEPGKEYDVGKKARILPILPPKEDKHFPKRKMLACYIINQSLSDLNFGDTKFEKLLHLSDYWAIQRNFQQRYYQKAAGPYDNAFTRQFFQQVLKAKWYKKIPYGNMNRIVAGEKQEKSTNTYGFFTEEELAKVDQLITYFRKYTYEQPEIISTLYAVWNNRLILGQEISDTFLKQDFLDWDEKKKKYKDRLDGALQWMKDEGLVPDGWGKLIEKPKGQ